MAELKELVGQLPSWRIVKALKLWGDVNMRYDAPSTLPLELAIVEICNDDVAPPQAAPPPVAAINPTPAARPAARPEARPNPAPARQPAAANPEAPPPERPRVAPANRPAPERPTPEAAGVASAATAGSGDLPSQWLAAVKALDRCKGKKYNLGALLRDCKPDAVSLDDDTLVMPFAHRPNMERMEEEMGDPASRKMVTEALGKFFGTPYDFRLTLLEGLGERPSSGRAAQQSPLVRTALGMGARIVEEMVE